MHPQIRAVLEQQRFFKLICGASYRNTAFISTLARIFASAGAHVIDVGARPELVEAVKQGLAEAELPQRDLPLIMVSVGVSQDAHFLRVEKDGSRCVTHGYCANACPHGVFVPRPEGGHSLRLENCLGCDHCVIACPEEALTLVPREPLAELQSLLGACFDAGARAVEVHTGHGDRAELQTLLQALEPWRQQIDLLAFSLGAHGQSEAELLALARDLETLAGPDILIQADGQPISGRKGKKSTLPCLNLAQYLRQAGLKAYIQVSGGTNNLTGQMARELAVPIHGVGMGSFARKHLELEPDEPVLSPERYALALDRARELVHSV